MFFVKKCVLSLFVNNLKAYIINIIPIQIYIKIDFHQRFVQWSECRLTRIDRVGSPCYNKCQLIFLLVT